MEKSKKFHSEASQNKNNFKMERLFLRKVVLSLLSWLTQTYLKDKPNRITLNGNGYYHFVLFRISSFYFRYFYLNSFITGILIKL
jgi:hypothetical protein